MRVLAIDAAKNRPARGWALFEDDEHVASGTGNVDRNYHMVDWVAGEAPWMGGPLRGKGFITFCFYNGFLLRNAHDSPLSGYVCIPVREWKNAIMPGCAQMPKQVYTRNLGRMFPDIDSPDELDACGIAKSVFTFDIKQLRKWKVIV